MKFSINESIASIKAYEPGKPLKEVEQKCNITHAVKLASNENPFGFSPEVGEAVTSCLHEMNRYPESSACILREALADKYHVNKENIVVGNGSDDIIALLAHACLSPGDEALMPLPAFLMYEISVKTAKGNPVMVPLVDYTINLDGLIEMLSEKTKMIFITNPFNPTGSTISKEIFHMFLNKVPAGVLVIVDEAYIEFVRDPDVFNSLQNPLADPQIVTLRTFSKAYGLAGFRIGYGVMDKTVAEVLNRIRQPFNVNSLAQAAAVAALEDEAFLKESVAAIHCGLDFLFTELNRLGLNCLPTQSNFLMVDLKTDASDVFEKMIRQGVIVRSMKSYGFETFLRVNTGTPEENKRFISGLETVLKRRKNA